MDCRDETRSQVEAVYLVPERLDGGLRGRKQEVLNLKCLSKVDQAGVIDGSDVGYEKKMDSGLWA